MKLSEIKGDRVFDVIAEIIEPIVTIATDKAAARLFKREPAPEGMEPFEFFLNKLKDSLPVLISDHRDEIVKVMSVVNNVTPEEYVSELTMPKLFIDIMELVTDKEFMTFFT